MSTAASIRLARRAVVRVHGPEARAFLDRLLTTNATGLAPGETRRAALLTGQGKIQNELVIHAEDAAGTSYLLDLPRPEAEGFVKQLRKFKLGTKVDFEDVSDSLGVFVDTAGARSIGAADGPVSDEELAAYDAWRVAEGRAEQGVDYAAADVYPTDVNYDLLDGVDYKKGCFLGQEVTSRMKRRNLIRRRTLILEVDGAPPARGADLMQGELSVGTAMSAAGGRSLAVVRLDRLADEIRVEGRPARLSFPAWFPEDAKKAPAEDA